MDTGSRNTTTFFFFFCFLSFLSSVVKNRIWKTENPYSTSMKLFEDGANWKWTTASFFQWESKTESTRKLNSKCSGNIYVIFISRQILSHHPVWKHMH